MEKNLTEDLRFCYGTFLGTSNWRKQEVLFLLAEEITDRT